MGGVDNTLYYKFKNFFTLFNIKKLHINCHVQWQFVCCRGLAEQNQKRVSKTFVGGFGKQKHPEY